MFHSNRLSMLIATAHASAAIMAAFVYNTAMREEMLPRKPLPQPEPANNGEGGRGGTASERRQQR
jgi:hypothetical protein